MHCSQLYFLGTDPVSQNFHGTRLRETATVPVASRRPVKVVKVQPDVSLVLFPVRSLRLNIAPESACEAERVPIVSGIAHQRAHLAREEEIIVCFRLLANSQQVEHLCHALNFSPVESTSILFFHSRV